MSEYLSRAAAGNFASNMFLVTDLRDEASFLDMIAANPPVTEKTFEVSLKMDQLSLVGTKSRLSTPPGVGRRWSLDWSDARDSIMLCNIIRIGLA